jgi:hypothetical protein
MLFAKTVPPLLFFTPAGECCRPPVTFMFLIAWTDKFNLLTIGLCGHKL